MDAVKFIKKMGRMCDSNRRDNCDECPFSVSKNTCFMGSMWHNPEEAVEIVELWDKEHPAKTYKDDFLEKFPNAVIAENICRYHVYKTGGCDGFTGDCELCWNEPIEE